MCSSDLETFADAQVAEVRNEMLTEAMGLLNDRERHILTERRLTENPQTLEELSQVYDVSRERIRQIEAKVLQKMRDHPRSASIKDLGLEDHLQRAA